MVSRNCDTLDQRFGVFFQTLGLVTDFFTFFHIFKIFLLIVFNFDCLNKKKKILCYFFAKLAWNLLP